MHFSWWYQLALTFLCISRADLRMATLQRREIEGHSAVRLKKKILLAEKKIYKSSLWLTRSTRRRAAPSVDLSASIVEVGHPLIFIVPVATYIEILVFIIQF